MTTPRAICTAICIQRYYGLPPPGGPASGLARGEQHVVPGRVRGQHAFGEPDWVPALRDRARGGVARRRVGEDQLVAVEPERALGRRRRTLALPGVDADVVVVATG